MTLTVSPQIKLVASLGGIAALGLAAFMLTMGRSSPGVAQQSLTPAEQAALHGTPKAKVQAKRKVTPAAKPKSPAKPRPAHVKRSPASIALLPGLPPHLASALRKQAIVVVSVFNPQAKVDGITRAEAAAAAAAVGAGFVPLNVLDQRQAGPLVRQLGVLPDPAVLVYERPGKLIARFDGFADRDTVAQAVVNASTQAP